MAQLGKTKLSVLQWLQLTLHLALFALQVLRMLALCAGAPLLFLHPYSAAVHFSLIRTSILKFQMFMDDLVC
jgi:hypothetical protein